MQNIVRNTCLKIGNRIRLLCVQKAASQLSATKNLGEPSCRSLASKTFSSMTKKTFKETWDRDGFENLQQHIRLKQPLKRRTSNKDRKGPTWLGNIHADLMKSVKLPKNSKGIQNNSKKMHQHLVSPSELLTLAASLRHNNKDMQKVVTALWQSFDSMSLENMLTAADVFYMNGLQSSLYLQAMTNFLYENIESVQFMPSQMVRLVFHIQQSEFSSSSALLLSELEKKMEESLDDFSIDEVAYVCHLLFYGQHRLRSMTLIDKIADKLLQEFDTLTPHNLPMMMKAFRFSNYIKVSFYKELGDRLVSSSYLQNFSKANQIMHFAFAFASVRITHHSLFKNLLQRVQELEHPPRLKDLSKIIWACGTLVTTGEEHLTQINTIVEQVKESCTKKQVLDYPDNLMDFLVGLAYLKIYPLDLIDKMLSPDVIKVLLDLDASRAKFLQLQFLESSLAIECPQFQRSLLTKAERRVVETNLQHFTTDVDMRLRKPLTPVMEALKDMLGEECVQCCFVLPHFKTADIFLVFDTYEKQFVNPSATDNSKRKNIIRVIVMLLSKAQTSYDNQPLGMLQCKLRQLKTLGYTVIQIDADEALNYTLMDSVMIQQQIVAHISKIVDYP